MIRSARLFFVIIFAGAFCNTSLFSTCWAQEESNLSTATLALQQVLSTLKQSVDKLGLDNDQLEAQNESIRAQVLQLQQQLERVKDQGDVLDKAVDKLRAPNPGRVQQVTRLEEENSEIDDRLQHTQGAVKLVQQSLDSGYQEDQKLLLQLKGMTNAPLPLPEVQSPESQDAVRLQKEKLRLLKMIYDSQQRQEALHESILEFQKNTPLLPGASALAHQQLLKEQIKDLETQIAAYPQERSSANGSAQWDDDQLHQLELELKALETNYSQLKDLTGQMGQKAQKFRMTVSQQVEGEKLQGSVDDLNRQSEALRADMDDLRSQLVDLDKRKSYLETMIKQL